ncbi:MAG TPA: DUF4396 domain-containing protein [Ktedonobacterales bacterium]|jgi:hypothetical protein|nr:DUF4396 domain-containing protein [Ktedonobacterales bacterium]
MPPLWFEALASIALGVALLCCLTLIIAVARHPQKMAIMNWVWPITALYFGPVAIYAFWKLGSPRPQSRREQSTDQPHERQTQQRPERETVGSGVADGMRLGHGWSEEMAREQPGQRERTRQAPQRPFWQTVWLAVTHCGAGCTLGDIIAEFAVFFFAWKLAGVDYWPDILLDFTLAYLLGIIFQYFTIAPMRGISGWPGVWAAIKADTLSLIAFEVGLFAWMALSAFVFFPGARPDQPVFWLMMQIGMIIGFGASFPMNWWLVRRGIKEQM